MTISQETVVNQIEITEGNEVQVRFELRVKNGDIVLSSKWHRTSFDRSVPNSVDLQMYAVNTHLVQMGEQPVGADDIAKIRKFAALAWA